MKTALVHDWLVGRGGAEYVLSILYQIFPSPIYTLIEDPAFVQTLFSQPVQVYSSSIQSLPFAKKHFRNYLPFFPLAIEQFDLHEYEVVISSSHCVAKGVLTHAEQLHICYCHTPMRYIWDLGYIYLQDQKVRTKIKNWIARRVFHSLRSWDLTSSVRVDRWVCNSRFVARRIEKLYGKPAQVIYPPVETQYFTLEETKEDFYVAASRLVFYKRMDVIVEAFRKTPHRRLFIIGEGPEREALEKRASSNVVFLGYQPQEVLKKYLQKAKGFIFAALEDFGSLPVEAMACGTAVLAFGKGGARETVREGETGLFFEEQTPEALLQRLDAFEQISWNAQQIREHAENFSEEQFQRQFCLFVEQEYENFLQNRKDQHPSWISR